MRRAYHKDELARRRTQALLRLFRTQAPADFRVRVLRRAQALPCPTCASCTPLTSPRSSWERYRSWLMETWHSTPRLRGLALSLGGACVLILGLRLAGWPPLYRGSLTPGERTIAAVAQPGEQFPSLGELGDSVGQDKGAPPAAVRGPVLATGMGPPPPVPPAAARETRGAPAATERPGMPPLVPPTPWAIDETLSNVQTPTPRAGHKRALAGKGKRHKKNQGTGKHAPA